MMKKIKIFGFLFKGCCPAAMATTPGEIAGVITSLIGAKLKPTFLIQLYFPFSALHDHLEILLFTEFAIV